MTTRKSYVSAVSRSMHKLKNGLESIKDAGKPGRKRSIVTAKYHSQVVHCQRRQTFIHTDSPYRRDIVMVNS